MSPDEHGGSPREVASESVPLNAVTIEESDEARSIVTPDLRLRFRRVGDRWTHAIDIRPGPWLTVAEAVEWSAESPSAIASPTYQELHFQVDGDDVIAFTVGQSGSHHFSATFRVTFRAYRTRHFSMDSIVQDRSESRVAVDVADRCRSAHPGEARYWVPAYPILLHLPGPERRAYPEGFPAEWKSQLDTIVADRDARDRAEGYVIVEGLSRCLVWEARISGNYHVALEAAPEPAASLVSLLGGMSRNDLACIVPALGPSIGTSRFGYSWEHARVKAFERAPDADSDPLWSLAGCPDPRSL